MNLTTKERMLLEDQKRHEELCIQKYSDAEQATSCPELKNICRTIGQKEKEHLNSINQLLSGQIPSMGNQQGSQQQQQQQQQQMKSQIFQAPNQQQSSIFKAQSSTSQGQNPDKDMCSDLLMTEKYVSGTYDTAIFEFKNTQVRDVLNHIQKEEQQHGDTIYKYMESKGMYA